MNRVAMYVTGVVTIAIAAVLSLYSQQPAVSGDSLRAALCFGALACLALVFRYNLAQNAFGSIAFIPFLATITLAPNWAGVAAVATSHAIAELLARRAPLKAAFNIAQITVSAAFAAQIYSLLGGTSLLADQHVNVVAMIGMFATFLATNTTAVSAVIALSQRQSFPQVWRKNTAGSLGYDVLSLPVVYFLAKAYAVWGAVGALALAVPLFALRQLYKTNSDLERVNRELLELMVMAIEARDPYTSGHSRRVAQYSRAIARAMGLSSREVERIGIAALLHDVGKIHEIYAPLLRKPGRLTLEERMLMQTHPVKSAELVQTVSHLRDVVPAVRHHHENWDGTGYPDGLVGEDIPTGARIIMLADTIDAMMTDRPYRKALNATAVRDEMVRMRGRQFDPAICDTLLSSPLYSQILDACSGPARTPHAQSDTLESQPTSRVAGVE